MSKTETLVAQLVVEGHQYDEIEGAGSRSMTLRRPQGTGLRNDGYQAYWMLAGQTYELHHDGTGWRVECRDWTAGHVYRLVDALDGREWADTLITEGGIVVLDSARTYEIREAAPSSWALYAV